MSPEQKIVTLTTVVNKIKDDNLKLSNYVKASSKNHKLNCNQSHPVNLNSNGKGNKKCKKYIQMRQQDKWQIESPKEGYSRTNNINRKTYHWCPQHAMSTVHKIEVFDMAKKGNNNTSDSESQAGGGNVQGKNFSRALDTILGKTREEEDRELLSKGSQCKLIREPRHLHNPTLPVPKHHTHNRKNNINNLTDNHNFYSN